MHKRMKNSTCFSIVTLILTVSCGLYAQGPVQKTGNETQKSFAEFALSSPNHLKDFRQLQAKLKESKIDCHEGLSSLGTISLEVDSAQFEKAKKIAVKHVKKQRSTLRLRKNLKSDAFEVYEKGELKREETYIKRSDKKK